MAVERVEEENARLGIVVVHALRKLAVLRHGCQIDLSSMEHNALWSARLGRNNTRIRNNTRSVHVLHEPMLPAALLSRRGLPFTTQDIAALLSWPPIATTHDISDSSSLRPATKRPRRGPGKHTIARLQ